ncbi:transposase [bacterium]|nr:transposase [bacterium]
MLGYQGRYTHRVAISNNRITAVENGRGSFTYNNRDRNSQVEIHTCRLAADLFIKRFLFHELPPGFIRIRHFGFSGNDGKTKNLEMIRRALNVQTNSGKTVNFTVRLMLDLTGIDITRCPRSKQETFKKVTEFDSVFKTNRAF